MSGYQSNPVAVCLTVILMAGLAIPASAQPDPIGACCHEGDAPVEAFAKVMDGFCIEDSEINCTEGQYLNAQWYGEGTTCGVGPFVDLAACRGGIIGLPVELTSFDAVVDDGAVMLMWATASETNNAGFAVEQEVGTEQFAEIGYVEGHGSTDEAKEYSFAVTDLDPGAHRFRLKQIDFDGAFEYSSIVEAAVTLPRAS